MPLRTQELCRQEPKALGKFNHAGLNCGRGSSRSSACLISPVPLPLLTPTTHATGDWPDKTVLEVGEGGGEEGRRATFSQPKSTGNSSIAQKTTKRLTSQVTDALIIRSRRPSMRSGTPKRTILNQPGQYGGNETNRRASQWGEPSSVKRPKI